MEYEGWNVISFVLIVPLHYSLSFLWHSQVIYIQSFSPTDKNMTPVQKHNTIQWCITLKLKAGLH
jgi:hypothetical protein